MADVERYTFTYKEVAEALVKQQGIHEGLWGIYVEFAIAAANVGSAPESSDIVPAAIVPVQKMGLQRFPEANNLTVDAAEVNPAPKASQTSTDD